MASCLLAPEVLLWPPRVHSLSEAQRHQGHPALSCPRCLCELEVLQWLWQHLHVSLAVSFWGNTGV
jgi:hypothetical protein